ncbi:MAG TPA: FAD/NAD(P)-binding oxidoreductase [Williamwhitmania sp.]|nr:FAD/NAD(P)-binding oxidoreductase [Williamwhitmania sp.]
MARVVVLGAGIAGHTTSAFLRKWLSKKHEVVVVSPNQYYQWIPSNIWVGVGKMRADQVRFQLAPLYKRWGVQFKQARCVSIHPEGSSKVDKGFVTIEYVDGERQGETEEVWYDFLVNATGPKLKFEATEGLGPEKFTASVCSTGHAEQAWKSLQACFDKMKAGQRQAIVVGTGHALSTCQGAAFEYILNIDHELRRLGLRHMANIKWISNEYELGDLGMGGAFIKKGGYITSTKIFTESFFLERDISWIKQAGVYKVDQNKIYYENLAGEHLEEPFDFAMLIPAFSGHGISAFDKEERDITATLFAPNNFMKVDADYTAKPYEEWSANDWPSTYQNPTYDNVFAVGIAFAPPHAISKPMKSVNGTAISPAPPRTGMPSGVMGKIVAQNITTWIKTGKPSFKHRASMAKMGAACIVSAGYGLLKGNSATMTVSPIVPDWDKYPEWGRDINKTVGEPGLAGHWLKLFMHYMFLHKAKGYPFWYLLPE